MSGTVVVDGNASQSAGATGRGGLLSIRGDAAARCGISMKGIDIVVRGSVGHMAAFMAQKGCLVVCGDAGAALGDSIYEARLYVRGSVESLGADCVEKEMRAEHVAQLTGLLERARRRGLRSLGVPPLRVRPRALQLPPGQRRVVLMDSAASRLAAGAARVGALRPQRVIHEIQRAAREGVYDIRGFGAKRALPHFDDLVFLGASVSRYPLEGYRERCDTNVTLGARHGAEPLELEIPITIAGMSFGALSAPAKEALGRGATAVGTSTTTGDGGMTPEERTPFADARLPAAAVALRDEPRRPAPRGRDRDRHRPGREAGRRRDPARPQDLRARGGDARPAGGSRPAQRVPPSRLDRSRRPRDQDRRAARDHRLEEADLREDRRLAAAASTSRSPSSRAPTSSCSTACRAAPRRRRTCSSSTPGYRRSRRSGRPSTRSRSWDCTARCSSSCRAASAPAPTWPRRSRWAPTRCRSAPRR